MLELRPTSYRKNQVTKFRNMTTSIAEKNRVEYQENLIASRDTNTILKHLKSFNNFERLPKLIKKNGKSTSNPHEKTNLFNNFFPAVFSPITDFFIEDIKCKDPEMTKFDTSTVVIYIKINDLDTRRKPRGPNGYPPVFFQTTIKSISKIMHKLVKNIKRLMKLPDCW